MATLIRNDPYDANAIGSAWSSSPLGDPTFDDPGPENVAMPIGRDYDRDRRAKTGPLTVFATACVIAGCAAAGATLLGSPSATTVVVPGVTTSDIAPAAPQNSAGQ
jgi:hypothetical protein